MAFVAVEFMAPRVPPWDGLGTPAIGAISSPLTTTTERNAWTFPVPKSGTLRRFHFRIRTAATPVDVRASFQTIGADGKPNLTESQYRDVGSGSIAADTWITPGIMSSDGTDGGVKRTVTAGEWIGCVVRCLSAGSVSFSRPSYATNATPGLSAPYVEYHTGGGWAGPESRCGCLLLEYDDGSYAEMDAIEVFPFHAFNAVSFNSGSTPDEQGFLWTPTFTCKIRGIWYYCGAQVNHDVVFYTGSTATETISVDKDYKITTSACRRSLYFAAEHTLTAGVAYRGTVKATDGSSLTLINFEVAVAAYFDAMPLGQAFQHTQRTDAGAFSETTTKRPLMGFHFSALDDGATPAPTVIAQATSPSILYPYRVSGY